MFRKNTTILLLLIFTAISSFYFASWNLLKNQSKDVSTDDIKTSVLDSVTATGTLRVVSPKNSAVTPEYQVVSSPYENALVTVTLLDENGTYVQNHTVNLISSSDNTRINAVGSNVSNQKGQVIFNVNVYGEAAVSYTAYDVDANVTLAKRAKIAYVSDNPFVASSDNKISDYRYAAVGNSSMSVDNFKFQNLPADIKPNDQITFTIAAYDSANQPVTDYQGTITFTVKAGSEAFVSVPVDYTFTAEDLGLHTFSLAMTFKQNGSYTIEVSDTADPSVFGDYTFQVGPVGDLPGGEETDIKITSPISGSYNNASQVLTGTAKPGANLKIFENDIPMGDINADMNGAFTYTMGVLADGEHSIYVAEVDDTGSTIVSQSNVVDLTIDTTAPEVTNIVLDPSDSVGPGTNVLVQLYAKESLSKATLSFDNSVMPMELKSGYYEAALAAPAAQGKYPLNFVVNDELGNETKVDGKVFLTVKLGNTVGVPDVSGLKAEPFDRRVVLNWDVPQTAAIIKNYRVHYGLYADQLTNVIDTFTNAPTWYIPGTENGTQYFFAVTAVDEIGNESQHLSEIVSAVPNPEVILPPDPCVAAGTCGEENIDDLNEEPGE
ncbi:MAG: fibronectin type III domain-containing protein, partial [Candidatus Gracilibacteria bacterium]